MLKSAEVQSFYVDKIVDRDGILAFDFTLLTNIGIFTAKNIEFINNKELEHLIVVFRPGFGDILKKCLINTIVRAIECDYDPYVTYTPKL